MTQPTTNRITSIDIFRGLTILTMIFVNDLASIQNIPAWMKHAPTEADIMTFVDLVFPAFLFIVGMAIPFAIQKRIDPGETIAQQAANSNFQRAKFQINSKFQIQNNKQKISCPKNKELTCNITAHIWEHILIRTLGLIVLGVFMVNMESLNPAATGMSHSWWMLLLFIAAILVWNQYPKVQSLKRNIVEFPQQSPNHPIAQLPNYLITLLQRWQRTMPLLLRIVGFITLILLAVIYRGGEGDKVHWLQTSWWGILGLIGWAYLTCCAVYFLFRKNLPAMIGMLALFIALYIGDKNGRLDFLAPISKYIWLGGHIGGHSSITLAGVIIATLFLDGSPAQTPRSRMKWIAGFALTLYFGGYLLRPLYGISKNNATPTWCLYSSAICCLIFLLLYWIVDLKQIKKWARFLKPAGENPLLAYILPDIFYALIGILGIKFLARHFGSGVVGIIRSLVFALVMLWITGLLTRLKIRLHL